MQQNLLFALGGIAAGATASYIYLSSLANTASSGDKRKRDAKQQDNQQRKKKNGKQSKNNLNETNEANETTPPLICTTKQPVPLNYVSVGVIESCFPSCRGTPRQGFLMPTAKANLILHSDISEHTLLGLSKYSHVWILFHFHKNRVPKEKNSTAKQRAGIKKRIRKRFKAKINPPKLKDGTKVGVFSARTPHRPNAIGLTLVKLINVDIKNKTLELSGVDLVHGTPVVDIKPYVPYYDAITNATVPMWVENSLSAPMLNVKIQENVTKIMQLRIEGSCSAEEPEKETVETVVGEKEDGSVGGKKTKKRKKKKKKKKDGNQSKLYKNVKDMEKAVMEMLRLDMNSGTTANKVQQEKKKRKQDDVDGEVEVEEGPRIFYAVLDQIEYECHDYGSNKGIVVVNGELVK